MRLPLVPGTMMRGGVEERLAELVGGVLRVALPVPVLLPGVPVLPLPRVPVEKPPREICGA